MANVRNRLNAFRLAPLAAAYLSAFGIPSWASTTYVVENCDDSMSAATTTGTLRYGVVNAAETKNDYNVIDLSQVPQSCMTSIITLSSGELVVDRDDLTVQSSAAQPVVISGNQDSRVFHHTGGGTLELDYITVKFGTQSGAGVYGSYNVTGGCISSSGSVTLKSAAVTECTVEETSGNGYAVGGGIYAYGSIALNNSVISGNTADASADSAAYGAAGGGVLAHNGFLTAIDSTIDGNKAVATSPGRSFLGGGAAFAGLTIQNSTISNNAATAASGMGSSGPASIVNSTISGNYGSSEAISLFADTTVANSTIAFNRPRGLSVSNTATITLQSSILAGSPISDLIISDGSFIALSSANNLVVSADLPASVVLPQDTLQQDPQLCALANHGGPTKTHALLPTSPAVAQGSNLPFNLSFDQRGASFGRTSSNPSGTWIDIGAYQRQWAFGVDADDEIFCQGMGPTPSD